jgi:hypothetical protein
MVASWQIAAYFIGLAGVLNTLRSAPWRVAGQEAFSAPFAVKMAD